METVIYLVRHRETVDNVRQIMQGLTQGELNERGRQQARQVAERLAAEHVDAVVAVYAQCPMHEKIMYEN